MPNELAFFLIMIISLLCVFLAGIFGKNWLLSSVIVLALISSITAGKVIDVFGFSTSIATPIYAGIFLATDALSEIYSKQDAKKAIWIGLFANVFLISLGQLIIHTHAVLNVELADALTIIFNFIPRLVLAGLIAFIVAQNLDIWVFHKLKTKDKGRWFDLAIRNNLSTFISQGLDSIIVYSIAFYGIISNTHILQLFIVAWIVKIVVAAFDTPFLYILRNFSKRINK